MKGSGQGSGRPCGHNHRRRPVQSLPKPTMYTDTFTFAKLARSQWAIAPLVASRGESGLNQPLSGRNVGPRRRP